MVKIGNDWDKLLQGEFEEEYYINLRNFLEDEYRSRTIYPPAEDLFNALRYSSYENTKVVILGQDPYHEPGQAHGLCFSVNKGVTVPKQGVLLLNTVLTVRKGEANSHKGKGWEIFTDKIVKLLNRREKPMVFILWGANAKSKQALIDNKNHMIITGAHPSPLAAWKGFFGGGYFSKTNRFLELTGQEPIDWGLK